MSDPSLGSIVKVMKQFKGPTYGPAINTTRYSGYAISVEDHVKHHEQYSQNVPEGPPAEQGPHAFLMAPVYLHLNHPTREDIAGVIFGSLPFDRFLGNVFPAGVTGFQVIVRNSCGQSFRYDLNGDKVRFFDRQRL